MTLEEDVRKLQRDAGDLLNAQEVSFDMEYEITVPRLKVTVETSLMGPIISNLAGRPEIRVRNVVGGEGTMIWSVS